MQHVTIIGLPRCGTKFIKYQIRKSEKIHLSSKSELTFHNQANFKFLGKNFDCKKINSENLKKYVDSIELQKKNKIVFDKNTNFCLLHEDDLRKYKKNFENTKFILILRKPLDRDLSELNFLQIKKGITFDKKTIKNVLYFFNQAYNHSKIINKFINVFENNFKFFFFDDLISNPINFINAMFDENQNMKIINQLRPSKKNRNEKNTFEYKHYDTMKRIAINTLSVYKQNWFLKKKYLKFKFKKNYLHVANNYKVF